MFSPEISKIIKRMTERSERKEVNWHHSSEVLPEVDPSAEDYSVVFPKNTINIYRTATGGVKLDVLNNSGKLVISVSVAIYDEEFPELNHLLELAKMRSENIDDVLDEILNQLDRPGVIGDKEDNVPY